VLIRATPATMSTTILATLALAMMVSAQPTAPWRATYQSTADAFAKSAASDPLFDDVDGPERTVAFYVGLAWFESTLKPDAVGDKGHSVCLFQINDSNFEGLGVTRDTLLNGVRDGERVVRTPQEVCTGAANRMIRRSFHVCRARPLDERLGWYAAGGPDCDRGLTQSRHRVRKSQWLFANVKLPGADFLAVDP